MARTKRLFILAFIFTLLAVVAALFLVRAETERMTQKNFESFILFPKLAQDKNNVKIMQLEIGRGLSGVQKITLWRKAGEKFFRLRQANDFFANPDLANRLLYGFSTLKAEARRGASQQKIEKLGLVAPEKLGPAIRIAFYRFEPKNEIMASLLIGVRPEKISDVLGQSSIYVRREDTNEVYLARGTLPLRTKMTDWIDFDFFSAVLKESIGGKPFAIAKAQFSLRGKKGWVLRRQNTQSPFSISDRRGVPLRGLYDERRILAVENNLKNLRFSAVQPSKAVDFKRADIVIFESFSGLALIFEIVRNHTGSWAKINARTTSPKARAQAQKLRHHLDGFAFQLPPQAARRMVLTPKQLKKRK